LILFFTVKVYKNLSTVGHKKEEGKKREIK